MYFTPIRTECFRTVRVVQAKCLCGIPHRQERTTENGYSPVQSFLALTIQAGQSATSINGSVLAREDVFCPPTTALCKRKIKDAAHRVSDTGRFIDRCPGEDQKSETANQPRDWD